MDDFRSYVDQTREPSLRGRFSFFSPKSEKGNLYCRERGNAMFYVFLAVGLMAALTYAFVKDSRENMASQSSVRIAEDLYSQVNMIRAAVVQCAMEYPGGGGDIAPAGGPNGVIDPADNPNNPYPINPSSDLNPNAPAAIAAAADDTVKYLTCVGAPASSAYMFSGTNNQGRFLPPPPNGFTEWVYVNDANGVRIKITAPTDAASTNALTRLMNKFSTCQADLNYGGCGATCFTAWVQRNVCP